MTWYAAIWQITVDPRGFEIGVLIPATARVIGVPALTEPNATITLDVPVRLTRTGRSIRLVHGDDRTATSGKADPSLIRLLVKARTWWAELAKGEVDIGTLAQAEGVTRRG